MKTHLENLILQADETNVRLELVIFEPSTNMVYHYRKDHNRKLSSPAEITFECGCSCKV